MIKISRRKLKNKINAVDIVQNCFVKFLEYAIENPESSFNYKVFKRNLMRLCEYDNKAASKQVPLSESYTASLDRVLFSSGEAYAGLFLNGTGANLGRERGGQDELSNGEKL